MPHRGAALITLTVRQILLNKYLPLAVLFLLIPSFIAIYTMFKEPKGFNGLDFFVDISLFLFLQFFVLFYALIYGSSLLHDEIDKRTMTYLIFRGSKRYEVVIFKFIGLIISLNILFFSILTLTYVLFVVQDSPGDLVTHLDVLVNMCLVMFLGSLAYGAMFSLLSSQFKRPLMIGLLYAFIWELFIANIPLNIRRATVMYYLRSVFYHEIHIGEILTQTKMVETSTAVTVVIFLMLFFITLSCWRITKRDMH